jgi:pyruvate/2-oxoglutarate dehydrogenase complex dihydrolipoamide acyltransferase (E2) component
MKENIVLMKKSTVMQKGSIKIIHVKDRQAVTQGQPLFSISADKVNYQLDSPKDGFVKLLVQTGMTVPVGTLLACICDDPDELESAGASAPVASAPVPASAPLTPVPGTPKVNEGIEPVGVKKAMFEQMERAKAYVQATTFMEVDMSGIKKVRETQKHSYTSCIAHAVVAALRECPGINVSVVGERILTHSEVNLGVALANEDKLYVPVIHNADKMDLQTIEGEIKKFQAKGREDNFAPEDFEGGTFTITNSGIFGSWFFAPVINYPQSAIMGLGAVVDRPVAVAGQVVIRPIMVMSLSYDHRGREGSVAVGFLAKVKKLLEGYSPDRG